MIIVFLLFKLQGEGSTATKTRIMGAREVAYTPTETDVGFQIMCIYADGDSGD